MIIAASLKSVESRTRPRDGAIFAINDFRPATTRYEEIEAGLKEAGFTGKRLLRQGERMDAVEEVFKV